MAAVTICSDFGAQENKVCHCFHCLPHLYIFNIYIWIQWETFFSLQNYPPEKRNSPTDPCYFGKLQFLSYEGMCFYLLYLDQFLLYFYCLGNLSRKGWKSRLIWAVFTGYLMESQLFKREWENIESGDFPGGPVAKIPCSQCRGPRFYPWLGN